MLTLTESRQIRRLHAKGYSQRLIASRTGHSTSTIHRELKGLRSGPRIEAVQAIQRCGQCGRRHYGKQCLMCEAERLSAVARARL